MASAVSSVSPSPLTDEERTLLRDRLHTFGRSILTGKLALVAVNLSNCGLQNVDVLAKLPHLQKVDLSHNEVSDVSPLAGNHALKELNLSHNKLSSLEAFDEAGAFAVGTRTLARLNVSFNGIEALPENFNCTYLTHLDVSHNRVAKIRGLKQLTFLAELDLSYNCLTATTGVGAVAANVSSLSLAHNSISKIGPKFMQFGVLRSLDLSHNRICDLYNLSHCSVLRSLNLRQNFLSGVRQTEYLAKLNSLESLMIEDNALATQTDGFYRIIFRLENLTELNGEEISPEDRVKAANTYGGLELDHRRAVHARHVPDIPFENPFRVWEAQRDPPRLLVYATKAAGAEGQSFTFELWDEGEEYVIQEDPRTGAEEVRATEYMVLKAYDTNTEKNLRPVAVDLPFDDAELFLQFVTIATQASAKADSSADREDGKGGRSEDDELEARAAVLIQTLSRQKKAREQAAEAKAAAAAAEATTTLLAEESAKKVAAALSPSPEHSNSAGAPEAKDNGGDKAPLAAATAEDAVVEASDPESKNVVEVSKESESKVGESEGNVLSAQPRAATPVVTAVEEAKRAVLMEQAAFANRPSLEVDFPDAASEAAVAAANAGANNSDVIIYWNPNARFSVRFTASDVVVEPGAGPVDLDARLSYGGSKKGFAVEMFLPPTRAYQ
eukprot:INCI4068.3.p1 GENE.INCI4068.3~~INCI4068.3.p1  ORF type:complete len:669 (-),score=142.33 INCI4068.3:110-2116(-)